MAKTKKVPAETTSTEATKASAAQERATKYGPMPLFKTREGERIRRQPNSRRTKTYNAIQDGMTFDEVVAAGGHAGDLLNLIGWKNVMTSPECDTTGAENGRYARAFPEATAPAPAKAKAKATKKSRAAKK